MEKYSYRHEDQKLIGIARENEVFSVLPPVVRGGTLQSMDWNTSANGGRAVYQYDIAKIELRLNGDNKYEYVCHSLNNDNSVEWEIQIRIHSQTKFAFSGGGFYFTKEPFYPQLLIPSFCKFRIDPQDDYYSAVYLKLPFFGFDFDMGAFGVSLKTIKPYHFYKIERDQVQLAVLKPSIKERSDYNFNKWQPGEWDNEECLDLPETQTSISGEFNFLNEGTALDLAKDFVGANLDREETSRLTAKELNNSSRQALKWLGKSFDPIKGMFLESYNKDREDFLNDNYFALPLFNLLLVDLSKLEQTSTVRKIIKNHLEGLLKLQSDEGVFKNTVSAFETSSHLGTGFGGYPGGQGVVLQNLSEYGLQSSDQSVLPAIKKLLEWIESLGIEGKAYPHSIYYFKERSPYADIPEEAISLGGSADLALGLIACSELLSEDKWLNKAKGIIDTVNTYHFTYGYHRDYDWQELDGASAISIILANVKLYMQTEDDRYRFNAERWGKYLLTWHKFFGGEYSFNGMLDAISWSFGPRVSPSDTALAALAYQELFDITNDVFWHKMAEFCLSRVVRFQHKSGGLSEGLYLTREFDLIEVPFESAFAIDFYLRALSKIYPEFIPDQTQVSVGSYWKMMFFYPKSLLAKLWRNLKRKIK